MSKSKSFKRLPTGVKPLEEGEIHQRLYGNYGGRKPQSVQTEEYEDIKVQLDQLNDQQAQLFARLESMERSDQKRQAEFTRKQTLSGVWQQERDQLKAEMIGLSQERTNLLSRLERIERFELESRSEKAKRQALETAWQQQQEQLLVQIEALHQERSEMAERMELLSEQQDQMATAQNTLKDGLLRELDQLQVLFQQLEKERAQLVARVEAFEERQTSEASRHSAAETSRQRELDQLKGEVQSFQKMQMAVTKRLDHSELRLEEEMTHGQNVELSLKRECEALKTQLQALSHQQTLLDERFAQVPEVDALERLSAKALETEQLFLQRQIELEKALSAIQEERDALATRLSQFEQAQQVQGKVLQDVKQQAMDRQPVEAVMQKSLSMEKVLQRLAQERTQLEQRLISLQKIQQTQSQQLEGIRQEALTKGQQTAVEAEKFYHMLTDERKQVEARFQMFEQAQQAHSARLQAQLQQVKAAAVQPAPSPEVQSNKTVAQDQEKKPKQPPQPPKSTPVAPVTPVPRPAVKEFVGPKVQERVAASVVTKETSFLESLSWLGKTLGVAFQWVLALPIHCLNAVLSAFASLNEMCDRGAERFVLQFAKGVAVLALLVIAIYPFGNRFLQASPVPLGELPYTVQVAVYDAKLYAQSAVDQLRGLDYDAFYMRTLRPNGKQHYRVYVGQFATEQEANDARGTLTVDGRLDAYKDAFVRLY